MSFISQWKDAGSERDRSDRASMGGSYYVYILASRSRRLYVGVTNDLARRLFQHRTSSAPSFTRRYNVTRLVHAESFERVRDALVREKQLKGWSRRKKMSLIELENPQWLDLAGTTASPLSSRA